MPMVVVLKTRSAQTSPGSSSGRLRRHPSHAPWGPLLRQSHLMAGGVRAPGRLLGDHHHVRRAVGDLADPHRAGAKEHPIPGVHVLPVEPVLRILGVRAGDTRVVRHQHVDLRLSHPVETRHRAGGTREHRRPEIVDLVHVPRPVVHVKRLPRVDPLVCRILFHVRDDAHHPTRPVSAAQPQGPITGGLSAGRESLMRRVVVVQPEPHLLEIVAALHPARGLASRLHRGQQQRDQNPDDRNDDE